MGVTWDAVAEALRTLRAFVREAGLWYTIADERDWTDELIDQLRGMVTDAFGPWAEAVS
jgi:hypothetical protein